MMGERSGTSEPRVSGAYGTLIVVTLALLGVALFAGAGTALADETSTTVETTQTELVDQPTQVDAQHSQAGVLAAENDSLVAEGENVKVEEDGIVVEGTEFDVELLTSQVGDAEVQEGRTSPMDIQMVPEQNWAAHTYWGSYFPASGTIEQVTSNTEIMTSSTRHELETQSFTAIGELFGWEDLGWEIEDVYKFDCEIATDEYTKEWPPWDSDEYPWCGWHDDTGSPPSGDNIYHVDSDTTISLLKGFNIDRSKSQYEENVLTEHSTDGTWQELPSADRGLITGTFGDGFWEYTDDTTDDAFVEEVPSMDVAPNLRDLYYIEYNVGDDVWGFDPATAKNNWIRIQYDALLTSVEDMDGYDPFGERYVALDEIVDVLATNQEFNDRAGVIINGGKYNQGHELSGDLVEVKKDIFDMRLNLSEERDWEPTQDFFDFNVDEGFDQAVDEIPENDSREQTVVIVSNGHHPLQQQNEWYENVIDGIQGAVPDFITDATGWDPINPPRPDASTVGPELDQKFMDIAEEANAKDVNVVTVGVGPAHDSYRLAATADAANPDSDCLGSGIDSENCNYVSVESASDLQGEMVNAIFEDNVEYAIGRGETTISANGDPVFEGNDINDIQKFHHNDTDPNHGFQDTVETDVGEHVSFSVSTEKNCDLDQDESNADLTEKAQLGNTDNWADTFHFDCNSGDTVSTDDAMYFTHGQDLEELDKANPADWAADPSTVLEEEYPELVDEKWGELDLLHDDGGETSEGIIVALPVDTNPEGYALLHVDLKTGLESDFQIEIQEELLDDYNDNWHELEGTARGVPAGESMTVPVEVTNEGDVGTEQMVLQRSNLTGSNPVVDSKKMEIADSKTFNFTWETDDSRAGWSGDLIARTENDKYTTQDEVNVVDPEMDLSLNIDQGNLLNASTGTIMDQPINLTKAIQTDTTVIIPVDLSNTGATASDSVPVSLSIGESIDSQTAPIAAFTETMTADGSTVYDNETAFFGWKPAYGDLEDLEMTNRDELGDSLVATAEAADASDSVKLDVVYVPQSAQDNLDDDDPEGGELNPIDVDIDEVEIEG